MDVQAGWVCAGKRLSACGLGFTGIGGVSVDVPTGDITSLLASLSYRLEPRLKACGIELVWAVVAKLQIHSLPGRSAVELHVG